MRTELRTYQTMHDATIARHDGKLQETVAERDKIKADLDTNNGMHGSMIARRDDTIQKLNDRLSWKRLQQRATNSKSTSRT